MNEFKLVSSFKPQGDQPKAIQQLIKSIRSNSKYQTLLGVTGSGKTYTLANVIAAINKPVLLISHNKTLAAQLYSEFKEFFPENAVEYFVSYYDYYQPEAYIPSTDTYIEKDASINERLDRLRLSATTSLMSRKDVIIVSSVSCIYNLGSPEDYRSMLVMIRKNETIDRDEIIRKLIKIQYERNDYEFSRGKIRVRGDCVDIYPSYAQTGIRVQFQSDAIVSINEFDPVSGKSLLEFEQTVIYPAKHFLVEDSLIDAAIATILQELSTQVDSLKSQNKLVEAQRLESRTRYDMEMLKEIGYCHGIENYSRHLSKRPPGSRPFTLIDYFPDDFLTIIDESHVTVPQIRGMFEGDKARKKTLVEYGFRLPSCMDNRPLMFEEFSSIIKQEVFVSATPSPYELSLTKNNIFEQIIRPTGIIDPEIIVRPTENQIDDLIHEIKERAKRQERVLVTTLTKRMAEDLTAYLQKEEIKVKYVHSEVPTIERSKILKGLRQKEFDCLVGINLLREGIDLPEVTLVAILDADKEGFLRSTTSLIQVAGRAARNIHSIVLMYADTITDSMQRAISESNRRRAIQIAYNKEHHITPATIISAFKKGIEELSESQKLTAELVGDSPEELQLHEYIHDLEYEMELAARNLQFEKAALLRDKIKDIKQGKV